MPCFSIRFLILFTFVLSLNGPATCIAAPDDEQNGHVLLPHDASSKGVYRWSEGSTVLLDGKKHLMMLVTAFGYGGHDHTAANIVRLDSFDGGLTWTPQKDIKIFQENIGKENVMCPSLLRLANGDILAFFLVKNSATDCGTWMRRSHDDGKTWSNPQRLPYEGYSGLASDQACQTLSGRIILPCWQRLTKSISTGVYCLYSDDGKTWKRTDLVAISKDSEDQNATNPAAEEPAVVELKDGRLMMFMRTYLKSIYVSYSEDGGATWSDPQSSGIPSPGAMPTLKRMPNGDLLLMWNWAEEDKIKGAWPRNRISSVVSTDDGKTWTSLRHLDGSDDFPGKITMANVTFCEGNAVVTYSKSITKENAYNWCLQVLPIKWFYEGDKSVVLGKKPQPRQVGRAHQLFIDDELIEEMEGLEKIVNQPAKYDGNPVLTYDKPWEGNCVITWGTVLYDEEEKIFKIWYQVYVKYPPAGEGRTRICYATSRDGIHWVKPELGLVSFRSSKANNIVLGENVDAPTVFRNPRPTPERKYLMFWYCPGWDGDADRKPGMYSAASPDGIHWTPDEGMRVESGDRNSVGYDADREKFFLITRVPERLNGSKPPYRTCGLWESKNGLDFEYVKEIAVPDSKDPPRTEFYGMIRFPYEALNLAFLEVYHVPIRKLNTQLLYSHDGLDWHRVYGRQTFMQWGPPGSWDQTWVVPSTNPPIRAGKRLYIFYQGRQTLHGAQKPFGHIASIGLAFLRVDGFVSLETQWNEGHATTVPLLLSGKNATR